MNMQGQEVVPGTVASVWAALNDLEVLKICIPGCEHIERIDEENLCATVTLRVGPITANFKGGVSFSDVDPPNGYTIAGKGSAGMIGEAKGSARVKLVQTNDGVLLTYDVVSEVSGKMAQLGSRLIDATARKLAKQFFTKFNALISGTATQEAVQS
jgi:carbon monoxide dehydrogenase subunit G